MILVVINFLKERFPELLFDHIYFKVDFIFTSSFTHEAKKPDQLKITGAKPSHPEQLCIYGCKILKNIPQTKKHIYEKTTSV